MADFWRMTIPAVMLAAAKMQATSKTKHDF